jgi:hypothetical protein
MPFGGKRKNHFNVWPLTWGIGNEDVVTRLAPKRESAIIKKTEMGDVKGRGEYRQPN